MDAKKQPPLADEIFRPVGGNPLRGLTLGLLIGGSIVMVWWIFVFHSVPVLGIVGLTMILVFDQAARMLFSPDRSTIRLTRDAIESDGFARRPKRLLWRDIAEMKVELFYHTAHLCFRMKDTSGIKKKRDFWTGANPSRPTLSLAPFRADAQERIVESIQERLRQAGMEVVMGELPPVNPMKERREFDEHIESLARYPWVSYALIGVNVLVWVVGLSLGLDFWKPAPEKLLAWGANAASEVQRGQWWRLFSAVFLHGGLGHLIINVAGLAILGFRTERVYGAGPYLLILLGSGLVGNAVGLHYAAQESATVGASGAIFGMMGATLAAFLRRRADVSDRMRRHMLEGVGAFVLIALVEMLRLRVFEFANVMGGLVTGYVLGVILPPRFRAERRQANSSARSAMAMTLLAGVTIGLTMSAPEARVDMVHRSADIIRTDEAFRQFLAAGQALQSEIEEAKAGKRTEPYLDERARTVHAPEFQRLAREFGQLRVPAGDVREPLVRSAARMAELMGELLAIETRWPEGATEPESVDPARVAAIEAELKQLRERNKQLAAALKQK